MGFLDSFSTDIGIDLGTCNTLIYVRDKGIVIDEPSVIAVEKGTKRIVAVGAEAKRMLDKTPGNIMAIRPLADGVIADIDSTEKMIKYFISKIIPRHQLFKSVRMKIGIPSCVTDVVVTHSIRVGGDKFDEAIVKHVKSVHNLIIGQPAAERLKIQIGNAAPEKTIEKMELKGTDAITGLPRRLEIDSVEVREALKEPVTKIVEEIKSVLSETPPELASDIIERGIVMTGGGSMLRELPKLVSKETGVPVILVEKPLECVALGAGKAFGLFKDMYSERTIYDSLND